MRTTLDHPGGNSEAVKPTLAWSAAALLLLLALVLGAGPARAQVILAMVNGDPVTAFDVEQRVKLIRLTEHKEVTQKQALEILIDERAKIKEGKRFGLEMSKSDVDDQFDAMARRMKTSSDQLAKALEQQGVRPESIKAKIKADYIWQQLMRGRFSQSLLVGDKEIQAALNASGAAKTDDTNSFEYSMRPVVLLVTKSAESSSIETRRKEAEELRARIQTCDEAKEIFRNLRDAVIRDPVQKTTADIPEALRGTLDSTPVGHLTPPEVTRQGVEMVALCDKKPTTIDSPQRREMRDKLFQRKFDNVGAKYLAEIRRSSMIEYR
jgi:peptidyl-prolyl cis-trans isomerase SurA